MACRPRALPQDTGIQSQHHGRPLRTTHGVAEIMRRRFRALRSQVKAEGRTAELRRSEHPRPPDGHRDWPDVVMIDGGKAKLSAVMEALRELDLHEELVVCLPGQAARKRCFARASYGRWRANPSSWAAVCCAPLRDEAHRLCGQFPRSSGVERMKTLPPLRHPRPGRSGWKRNCLGVVGCGAGGDRPFPLDRRQFPAGQSRADRCGAGFGPSPGAPGVELLPSR